MELLASVVVGIGLSAAAGFRVFVPLLGMSVAGYFGVLPLNDQFAWLGSLPALIILGVALAAEIGAYYLPIVDNFLDAIVAPASFVAGTLAMAAQFDDVSPVWMWCIAIIAGGGTGSLIHAKTGALRLASTATTGGLGNPLISTGELAIAGILTALSIFVPILALVLVLVILAALARFVLSRVNSLRR